uniref:uncharacterized protein LOC122604653 n=1 Tax=Erigeron canadensis TaxID=72917 RepID=UPI001CB89EF3|nr:uncharacterized protein LOC122604653 [Erigeron canadensis]
MTEILNFNENEKGFVSDYMINSDQLTKINKLKFKLDSRQVFNQSGYLQSLVSKAFTQKNKIFYCFNTEELSVDIKDTSGELYLPLLTKGEIAKRLLSVRPDLRKSLNMVHIGAVKILLKAQFRDGINFPIKMALVDNRIVNRQDALLGVVQGNLAYGNKVFTVNYLIAYAITNSTHSIEYKEKENITMEDIFSEIGTVEGSKFTEPSQLQENWAINIARNKKVLHQRPRYNFSNSLRLSEPSSFEISSDLMRSMSERIDKYGEILKEVVGI